MEAPLAHPAFDAVRPWLERAGLQPSLELLNNLAEQTNLRTASGQAVRFVPPAPADPYYEVQVFETGRVQTRPDNLHDVFNALCWLAFPRTKALINALHAHEIPRERGGRGRRRDLLTLLDEGGVIVHCDDAELASLIEQRQWKKLFWERREELPGRMRFCILGHATLEQALQHPRPGIACKAIFVPFEEDSDAGARAWLASLPAHTNPRELAAVPVFGYPGWLPQNAAFYDDRRYFRETPDTGAPARPGSPPGAVP